MSTPQSGLLDDLQRARTAVLEAELGSTPGERYLAAHAAALRAAAVILSIRTHPALAARRTGPRDAWLTVAEVAPELQEWAGFFAATAGKREAVQAGATSIVSTREADDLVRDVGAFLAVVERAVRRGPGTARTRLADG